MKIKLIGTVAALAMILGIGCAQSMGGAGGMGPGMNQGPDGLSVHSQGESGHDHEVPAAGGATGNPQSRQGYGGPLSCH